MNISEISVGQGNIDVEGTIIEIAEPRVFNKFGRELKVADAVLKDDSGTIKLNLCNEDAEKFKAEDKVKVTNGYAKEFQGEKQLTSGKFGQIEKIGGGEASESSDSEQAESAVSEEPSKEPETESKEESAEEPETEDKEQEDF